MTIFNYFVFQMTLEMIFISHWLEVNLIKVKCSLEYEICYCDLTLCEVQYYLGGKGTGRNVEVTVSVMLSNGGTVEVLAPYNHCFTFSPRDFCLHYIIYVLASC